ncbi:D-alanyl-D-alanine carboxypeptidase/D-alanyl-D-alanine endopeptidase [Thermoleophilum album]|nr:D-alanyl-D-alanine carboxypeptidase/D-alanyl-D-alanine-endopeptidase [Thermoleophilum album]
MLISLLCTGALALAGIAGAGAPAATARASAEGGASAPPVAGTEPSQTKPAAPQPRGSSAGNSERGTAQSPRSLLPTRLRRLLARLGGGGAALIVDERGVVVASLRARTRLVPASNVKLFTTAAALELFGPEQRWQTRVVTAAWPDTEGRVSGPLYLVGGGDPTLASGLGGPTAGTGGPTLAALARAVRDAGVRRVDGPIVADASRFDRLTGGPASAWRTSIWVGPLSALVVDRGLAPSGRNFVADPALATAQRFRRALSQLGVAVKGRETLGTAPADGRELAELASPPLSLIVRVTNRDSDNFFAEMLLKQLATRAATPGSTELGLRIERAVLQRLGVQPKLVDGSGLSRANRASPSEIVRLLRNALRRPWGPQWLRSLPLAGREGTLRRRFRSGPARGRCRAKTGTLTGVTALSGYCRARSGERYWFSLLANGTPTARARATEEAVVQALADS